MIVWGVALLSHRTSRHSVVAGALITRFVTSSHSAGTSVFTSWAAAATFTIFIVWNSAGTSISRAIAGVLTTDFLTVFHSAGTSTSRVVAGVSITCRVIVEYSAGTSTRHRTSPAVRSTAAARPGSTAAARPGWLSHLMNSFVGGPAVPVAATSRVTLEGGAEPVCGEDA